MLKRQCYDISMKGISDFKSQGIKVDNLHVRITLSDICPDKIITYAIQILLTFAIPHNTNGIFLFLIIEHLVILAVCHSMHRVMVVW